MCFDRQNQDGPRPPRRTGPRPEGAGGPRTDRPPRFNRGPRGEGGFEGGDESAGGFQQRAEGGADDANAPNNNNGEYVGGGYRGERRGERRPNDAENPRVFDRHSGSMKT